MCADLQSGDVVVGDRGYYSLDFFRELDGRGIVFVSRERRTMKCRVVCATTEAELCKGVVSDERVVMTDRNTSLKCAKEFRRVKAVVEIGGEPREMVFVTNNFTWSARMIADLYKSRWAVAAVLWDSAAT